MIDDVVPLILPDGIHLVVLDEKDVSDHGQGEPEHGQGLDESRVETLSTFHIPGATVSRPWDGTVARRGGGIGDRSGLPRLCLNP